VLIYANSIVLAFFVVLADLDLFSGFWQGCLHAEVGLLLDKLSFLKHVVKGTRVKQIIIIFIMILAVSGGVNDRYGCMIFIK
jgi:hypothetical protein